MAAGSAKPKKRLSGAFPDDDGSDSEFEIELDEAPEHDRRASLHSLQAPPYLKPEPAEAEAATTETEEVLR